MASKKGKGVSHLHTLSREWLFLSEVKETTRAASQMSSTSEKQLQSALKHLRQMSNPVLKAEDWDLPLGVEALVTMRKREGTDRLSPVPDVGGNWRKEKLPSLDKQFPLTLQVLKEKSVRKHGFKAGKGPASPLLKRVSKPKYHSAWYLPPSLWKTVSKDQRCQALDHAKTPYYSLQSHSPQFQENVKELQRMPMMGRFKGHLETLNLRVPPYLQPIHAEVQENSVSSSSSESQNL